MDIYISDRFIIENADNIEERIKMALNNNSANIDEAIEFIKSEVSTIFYFDSKLNLKQEDDKDITYAWLDTGYCNKNNEPIFISLLQSEGKFIGNYVGTSRMLANSTTKFYPNNQKFIYDNQNKFKTKYEKHILKRTIKHIEIPENSLDNIQQIHLPTTDIGNKMKAIGLEVTDIQQYPGEEITQEISIPKIMTPVTEEIFNQLLVKNWKSINGLDRYIKIIGCRIQQLIDQKSEQYYVMNHLGYVIVNTGLLNLFGTDILVYYRINKKYSIYEAYEWLLLGTL